MTDVVLKTIDLTKKYGKLTVVNHLNLEILEGEVFGFLGPNGAGKTTSINMICGLLQPNAGQVLIHGQPVAGTRHRVGVCPQQIVLWERLTCLEQLQFIGQMYGVTGQEARRRGEQLLEKLDLQKKRSQLARTLSGGMQRRLNLAMALVHDPEIVVLDEPEAGLDPQSRIKVREFIKSLARQKTVILTTHNMDEADRVADRVADRIAIIDHGELLVTDTPENLKHQVGEGDVVTIQLSNGLATLEAARRVLAALSSSVTIDEPNHRLEVRALNAVGCLPAILEALEKADLHPGEISIRANTLEDVFIQLTGRRLRE